ncbi:formate dehydrogenase, alpha subunit, archaeal-type [Longilinea arvoryzae]|uniref:Formate dehydrogenase, alpha subunit, archaeal-type n=1 Tax=Longilinea arvoryzae TaxID=360412 RepID=A0A0S7BIW0_9CHLR|nr:formate dehydrogenase subunit alpha [Longilinea arvoryzae]GAP14296.1 formate dehydrogenase, alpha subunit, archaeal-type [Longilinea arvoryzae]
MSLSDRVVSTTCPFCGVGCNLQLHIQDDFIYRVTSPFDSVVNHGNLCVKGRFGYDFIYNQNRITTPLIRRTPQKPGKRTQAFDLSEWREATWDEALDLIADRLTEIYQRDGSRAMAAYCCAKATNEDNYLMEKLFRALFRTNHIDHCTRLCHAASVVALQMAVGSSAMSNTAAEVIQNDVFIVTGSNTAENHPIIALQMKAAVQKHGAKLIVVDPRRVEMANYATLWLPEKPGSDIAVFSAMAHVILKEKLYNQEFIDQRTENFAEFAASMEKFTPEHAEIVSGVDRNLIIEAARLYGNARNGAIYWSLGIPEHSHGTANALALINLALLTGNIGRPGTGLNPLRGQNNVQGASDMGAMPWHYPGYQRVDDEQNARKFEQAWHIEPGGLNRTLGLTTTEIVSSIGPGGVRSLYIMGENPMMSEPNLNHTRHKLEQLEFLVAQDIFINESGAFADVFLPAASWAEKDGTFTNTDRRVQRVRQAIQARGQSRADWQIVCDLARRLETRLKRSTSAGWNYQNPAEVMREIGSVVPEYRGITYERIENLGIQTPTWDENHPGTPYLFAETFPRGRGKFHPLEDAGMAEMPDEDYPLILTTGRVLEHWHGGTLTRHSWLDDLFPEALMEIHPADAAHLKINAGNAVRVTSRRGSIVLRAIVTQKTTPGVVFIPFHFAEAAANLLTQDILDPQAKIPEYKACAVRVTPADESELTNAQDYQVRGRY